MSEINPGVSTQGIEACPVSCIVLCLTDGAGPGMDAAAALGFFAGNSGA